MSRDSINVILILRIIVNKSFNNKYCFEYENSSQTEWYKLKSFIMTFSFYMRSVCFSAEKLFFFKISLWLVDEKLYILWTFIEFEAFIEFNRVFIELCAFSLFYRRNCNVIVFTFLKCHVLCQLLSSMRLLI